MILLTAAVGPCESQEAARERVAASQVGAPDQSANDQPRPQDSQTEPSSCTSDRPAIVLSCPPASDGKSDNGKQKKDPYTFEWDSFLGDTFAQVFMAITGFGALGASIFALWFTRGTLNAQRQATSVAIQTFEEGRRAWVAVIGPGFSNNPIRTEKGIEFFASVPIKNFGGSPALNLNIAISSSASVDSLDKINQGIETVARRGIGNYFGDPTYLFPGEKLIAERGPVILTNEAIDSAVSRSRETGLPIIVHMLVVATYRIIGDNYPHQTAAAFAVKGMDVTADAWDMTTFEIPRDSSADGWAT